jgi:hypothetical protein
VIAIPISLFAKKYQKDVADLIDCVRWSSSGGSRGNLCGSAAVFESTAVCVTICSTLRDVATRRYVPPAAEMEGWASCAVSISNIFSTTWVPWNSP